MNLNHGTGGNLHTEIMGSYYDYNTFETIEIPNYVSLETTSGYDITGALCITRHSSATSTYGLHSADTDMVFEQLKYSKGEIANQVGLRMLPQVNASPQQLQSLFR